MRASVGRISPLAEKANGWQAFFLIFFKLFRARQSTNQRERILILRVGDVRRFSPVNCGYSLDSRGRLSREVILPDSNGRSCNDWRTPVGQACIAKLR